MEVANPVHPDSKTEILEKEAWIERVAARRGMFSRRYKEASKS